MGLLLSGIEVLLVVLVWRAGWRWKALLPSAGEFIIILLFWFVFVGPQAFALASEHGAGTPEYMTAMESLLLNHWLVTYGYLPSLAVIGVLLFMLRREQESPKPKRFA